MKKLLVLIILLAIGAFAIEKSEIKPEVKQVSKEIEHEKL